MTPEQLIQAQLDAYNAHDLERFIACYADDVCLYRPPATAPILAGKAAFADYYARERFTLPELRADLVGRLVTGKQVVDHERIHGLRAQAYEVIVAYTVEDGLIRTVCSFPAE